MRQRPPLLVKISPDLSGAGLEAVVETCVETGVQGLIVSTPRRRARLAAFAAREKAAGFPAAPLFPYHGHAVRGGPAGGGTLVLIGVGGVTTGRDALEKLRAGASLVHSTLHSPMKGRP